jgi:hypothetical protein
MTKFHYRPILDKVKEIYLENAGSEFSVDQDDFKATLIVEADSSEMADKIRTGITDITMWELDHEE